MGRVIFFNGNVDNRVYNQKAGAWSLLKMMKKDVFMVNRKESGMFRLALPFY